MAGATTLTQVLLEQFRDVDAAHGKLCVFDEAHKYLSGAGGAAGSTGSLAESIVGTVRQMRHYGLRVAISTQSPTALPPEVLELTSIAVCHRFHSRDWYAYLSKKIPLHAGAFPAVMALRPGQALVFAANHGLGVDAGNGDRDGHVDDDGHAHDSGEEEHGNGNSSNIFVIQIRKRLTADGGSSRTNKTRKPRATKSTIALASDLAGSLEKASL